MKILLFGITNVGKSTIGKILSKELKYLYDDLDDEIKKRYKKIDNFQREYPYDYDRHKKRSEILLDIVNRYQGNVVIAVSPIYYEEFIIPILQQPNVLAIEIQDDPENIIERLVYADEDDNIHPLKFKTKEDKQHYLKDIKADIRYYKKEYKQIQYKFDMEGGTPQETTKKLVKYIQGII